MTNKTEIKVFVGKIYDMPERLGKTMQVGNKEIAIFKLSNGTVRAVENRCPHKGGVLSEGMVSGEFVFCPMHDWKICLDNGKVEEPDSGCVQTYRTNLEGENVYLIFE
ncbi:nitrite reductase (NAD(P)H) small subunit [Bacillus canaveralius]|uniref:Nitrite reductase (NAD(P)H) small subunit n=1 Tax=Bacillus canaveralius TaxID=1403243 RepID=A0A2N5GMF0_9BACI|nr:nitrite reductase small subunit NirD [Bacillus canaveralius]PLR83028.1 nitrite reductase (NAD(P)H) small subunit [Bacillus canaveralius]PLR96968.1 nitrite reductase (NAD(P)H) small subunit [Bacillus canaveralius]RSK56653.1 nitrite reductase small subunit NirD [Bacillus canaveralius]